MPVRTAAAHANLELGVLVITLSNHGEKDWNIESLVQYTPSLGYHNFAHGHFHREGWQGDLEARYPLYGWDPAAR